MVLLGEDELQIQSRWPWRDKLESGILELKADSCLNTNTRLLLFMRDNTRTR